MKLYSNKADSFINQLSTNSALIYGNDQGAVSELGKKIIAKFLPNPEPMSVVDLEMDKIKDDERNLIDELSSMSFFSAKKLVIVKDAADSITKLLPAALENLAADTFLLIQAGELGKPSSLRKFYEDSKKYTALLCYKDDEASVKRYILDKFREKNIRADADAVEYLAANLGDDKMITNNELEKIFLYLGGEQHLKLEYVENLLADNNEAQMIDLALAVTSRNFKKIEKFVPNLFSQQITAVAIFRIISWHLNRLATAKSAIENGVSSDTALLQLRPPVFFKQADAFKAALRGWDKNKIIAALGQVHQAELQAKKSIIDEEVLCSKVLLDLCRI